MFADELAQCLLDAEGARTSASAARDGCSGAATRELLQVRRRCGRRAGSGGARPARADRSATKLVLAACRLYRESAAAAVVRLEALGSRLDSADAVAALRAAGGSCERLLEAAG